MYYIMKVRVCRIYYMLLCIYNIKCTKTSIRGRVEFCTITLCACDNGDLSSCMLNHFRFTAKLLKRKRNHFSSFSFHLFIYSFFFFLITILELLIYYYIRISKDGEKWWTAKKQVLWAKQLTPSDEVFNLMYGNWE